MHRVLVTGSSGLIGRWVCDKLVQENCEVLGFDLLPAPADRQSWESVIGDILDLERLKQVVDQFQPEAVIHLAARVDLDGESLKDYSANIVGVTNVCNVIRHSTTIGRAIFTSSQLVCRVGYIPKNDHQYCPSTVYGDSKVETELLVRSADGGGTTWCLTRPTTVWGPYMSDHYKSFLRHIARGTYFHVGSGPLLKSYAYAGNIAHQYVRLLFASRNEIHQKLFYMADYEPLSLREYSSSLARELGVRKPLTLPYAVAKTLAYIGDGMNTIGFKIPFNSFRLSNIRTEYVFDMTLTESVCGPLPYSFEQGVQETVNWYLETED